MTRFPYVPRPEQEAMVSLLSDDLRAGRSVVMESGTGTGKTVVSLAGAIEASSGLNRRIVFLTRTKSQQRQVSVEARLMDVVCVAMQGRGPATCPTISEDSSLADGTSQEMSRLCSRLKKGEAGGCRFYDSITGSEIDAALAFVRSSCPDPDGFREYCRFKGVCPYEMSKRLLPYAEVVSAPYAFYFIPPIREHLMEWMGVSDRDCTVIVDEAHNLPQYLRETETCRCTARALKMAAKEAEAAGNPEVGAGLTATDMVRMMQDIMKSAMEEFLERDNDLIPPGYLTEEMMTRLGMGTGQIASCIGALIDAGERVAAEKESRRKLPRSHMASLGRFILDWWSCDRSKYAYLISGGENPSMEAFCLDPSEAAEPLRMCHASVSMSGTLAPLTAYSRELGLYDPDEKVFESPFPKENLRIVCASDVSTRFAEINSDDGTFERIKGHIISCLAVTGRSSAVFFPSYALMDRYVSDGLPDELGREVFFERRGMPQSELMDQVMDFRSTDGGVLFAVTGGRVSEGLDFPGREMELAVVVGIPYARPSAKQDALIGYSSNRFGNGWDMAVKFPAVRKMRQAIGRLIRSENDRGMAVLLDRRAATLDLGAEPVADPAHEVGRFFENGLRSNPYIYNRESTIYMAIIVDDDVIEMIEKEKQDYRICTACMGPALVPTFVKPAKSTDVVIEVGDNKIYISRIQARYISRITTDMIYDESEIDCCPAFYQYSDAKYNASKKARCSPSRTTSANSLTKGERTTGYAWHA